MTIDSRALRSALGHFATGVTVVTYADGEQVRGATVNAFTSVSLDPPLVLVSLDKRTKAAGALEGRPFAVNVLRRDQQALALHFAGRPQGELPLGWGRAAGVPVIADCAAVFACAPWQVHEAGDHVLVLGRVEAFEASACEPLIFFRGDFATLPQPAIA